MPDIQQLPDSDTSLVLAEDWNAATEAIRVIVRKLRKKRTPKRFRKTRPGASGRVWTYAEDAYFIKVLDEEFPDWSFMHVAHTFEVEDCIYFGRLIVTMPGPSDERGISRVFDDVGCHTVKKKKDGGITSVGNSMKAAKTDCFKRCCAKALGIASDVYQPDEFDADIDSELYACLETALKAIDNYLASGITHDRLVKAQEIFARVVDSPQDYSAKEVRPILRNLKLLFEEIENTQEETTNG